MAVMDVPRNWRDHSTSEGFSFSFYCDVCRREFKSTFVRSKTDKMGDALGFAGRHLVGGTAGWAMRDAGSHAHGSAGMSKEKDQAFQNAFSEVRRYFGKCPKNHAWVCTDCWNGQANLCVTCAPRLAVEMASAVAQTQVSQMRRAVANTQQFTGPVDGRMALCPACGTPGTGGKFCNSCGAMMTAPACPTCNAANAPGARFCAGCGGRLS